MMLLVSAVMYVAGLQLFASSMCNPDRPSIVPIVGFLLASAVLFGVLLYRRLYGTRR